MINIKNIVNKNKDEILYGYFSGKGQMKIMTKSLLTSTLINNQLIHIL